MRIFLPALWVLCVTKVNSIFDGTCIRKDPPPGVLALPPGSKLAVTCRGHVMVNGVTVNIDRKSSSTNRRVSSSVVPTTTGSDINKHSVDSAATNLYDSNLGVRTVTGDNRSPRYSDTEPTASPTTHMVLPTSGSRLLKTKSSWEVEINGEGDYEEEVEEDGEEGSRVTRGINSSPQWKWNGKIVGKGKRDWGEITFENRGAALSLSSVRLTDSGMYTCHHRGRERFSVKVIVAESPENPSLSCYKKSPSSKIRCEWEPQKPTTRPFNCYLVLNKRSSPTFQDLQCSYSSRLSRYWCALDYNEDELRTLHMAYLCVTSITGNATSSLLSFTPLEILKPDPPSGVKVQQVEGRETYLKVSWNVPISWKSQDHFYELIYEIKYKPLKSTSHVEQTRQSKTLTIDITDVMPGVEYQIQVKTKDEYDGLWSDWSTPVSGRSWTAPEPSDLYTTPFAVSTDTEEGSTFLTEVTATEPIEEEVSYHALWISGSFLLLSVILAAYIFRHRDRFLLKLHHLSAITKQSELPQPPSGPIAPEAQALVTFAPPRYKEPPLSKTEEAEEENEEEHCVEAMIDAMHFNNTSYFLLQRQ